MDKTNTLNVISTPEITGNIGSCTSNSIVVDTGYNLVSFSYKTVVTNSCTGAITEYDSWGLGAFPWLVLILGCTILWLVFGMTISDAKQNRYL